MGANDEANGQQKEPLQPSLSVIILTRNEAAHLERALKSIAPLAAKIVVVDSGSTDNTIEIARAAGAALHQRPWVNYADQFQWALDHTDLNSDWIMRLDADEWFGPDLVRNIRSALTDARPGTAGFSLDRRHYFMGRWIKYGGRYPLRMLRIWRHGHGHIEQRWMDEHCVIGTGDIEHIDGVFVDENLNDLSFFTSKHNRYATREAVDALIAKYGLADISRLGPGTTRQASGKRIAKQTFYNRLPLAAGPLAYFLYRYIFQLGFLDGRRGLIYHVLQGFWYRFLVDAKRYELEQGMEPEMEPDARLDYLQTATGLDIRTFLARKAQDPKARDA